MKKRMIIGSISAVLLTAVIVVIAMTTGGEASKICDFEKALSAYPFCSGNGIEKVSDRRFTEIHPDLHGYTDGGEYSYWMNESGKIEYITFTDTEYTFPGKTEEGYGKKEAARDAEKWFDDVFYREEAVFGKEKDIESYDFNGGFFLTVIKLIYRGAPTGNEATFSVSADGKLVTAGFIYSEKKPEDITEEQPIDQGKARELAVKALQKECLDLYGEEVILHTDQISERKTELRVFKDQEFWEYCFFIPAENLVDFENPYNLYCEIRIDSQTGECLGIATPLK